MGRTIAESGLRDKDLVVLTLHRGGRVISVPKSSRVLEANDRVLCYGKLELMRDLVPARRERKRPRIDRLETEVPPTQVSS